MDEQQLQQQIIALVQAAMQGDQQANQQIQQIMQAAQQGDQQAMQIAQMIQQVAQAMQQQGVQAAKFGAKLNYFKQLKGICPEGYEMQVFKAGGRVCKKCMKKQDGGDISETKNTESLKERFMKCGGKSPKKKENGGNIPFDKCGKKMKKKEDGGSVEMEKCGGKPKMKKACGGLQFKANGGILENLKTRLNLK